MKEDFVARSRLKVHDCLSFVSGKYVKINIRLDKAHSSYRVLTSYCYFENRKSAQFESIIS